MSAEIVPYLSGYEFHFHLVPAPDDPALSSQEYQKGLRKIVESLETHGVQVSPQIEIWNAADGGIVLLGEFVVALKPIIVPIICAAIGITDYLENGGDINIAKRMAGHSNIKTTELYDRRGDEVSFSEIERVGI